MIVAFLAGCIAIGLAWTFSQEAFRQVLDRVEQLSTPDEKLSMVNRLFRDVTSLSQSQRTRALLHSEGAHRAVARESKPLMARLDSLRLFYQQSPEQIGRIDSMKKLLQERDKLFINYLRVREGLVDGKVLSEQMESLSGLISTSRLDSTVITTEKKIYTTTVIPPQSADTLPGAVEKKEASSGLLARIFGKKKEVEAAMADESRSNDDTAMQPRRIIEEVINIKIDTLALAKQDSLIEAVQKLMDEIREDQRQRTASFVNREMELLNAGNVLVNEVLGILQEMEREAVTQNELSNARAREIIHDGIRRMVITMLVFLLLTAVLVYLTLSDISRSSRYQKELEAAKEEAEYHSNAKLRFLSNMSHELRTPLQSIIGYADLLRQQSEPDRKWVEAIYHSSEHLLQVVNEVLDYNRIISGKFSFEPQVVDLKALLEEVVGTMRNQAVRKNLELQYQSDIRGGGFVRTDPFRLKQVLYNLLGNAIKFTQAGTVSLSVTDEASGPKTKLCFRIADTGCGIPKEDLSRIFHPYEQAGQNSVRHHGTGLGLNIVNILVGKMGGTILVHSEPGKGTVFTVQLKLESVESLLPVQGGQAGAHPPHAGKIWVIDDDPSILEWCEAVFRRNGILHRCFQDPLELLEQPWEENLEMLLIDIRMPIMEGTEVCRRMRAKFPSSVKFYALTAQVLPDERENLLKQGFDGILMKPFRQTDLLELLRIEEHGAGRLQAASFPLVQPSPPPSADPQVTDARPADPHAADDGMTRAGDAGRSHTSPGEASTKGAEEAKGSTAKVPPVNNEAAKPGAPDGPPAPAEFRLNLAPLKAMTLGDPEEMRKILSRFAQDSKDDLNEVYRALGAKDDAQLLNLLHRMAGRTAQMGARELAARLRTMEACLRQSGESATEAQRAEIRSLMEAMTALLENLSQADMHRDREWEKLVKDIPLN